MATAESPAEQRLRLSNVSWDDFVRITDGLGPRHLRMTYDRGELELMTVSFEHENRKKRCARLIEALTEEMDIDIVSCGSMTFRREDVERGLEGDECYWIANEAAVRGRMDIDPETDPPPDLALEVDISRSSLNRMSIYAALRVPEVWRWDGRHLRIFLLTPNGTYEQTDKSKAFPFLPLAEFVTFLKRTDLSETQLVRSFRNWVGMQIDRGWGL